MASQHLLSPLWLLSYFPPSSFSCRLCKKFVVCIRNFDAWLDSCQWAGNRTSWIEWGLDSLWLRPPFDVWILMLRQFIRLFFSLFRSGKLRKCSSRPLTTYHLLSHPIPLPLILFFLLPQAAYVRTENCWHKWRPAESVSVSWCSSFLLCAMLSGHLH